MIQLHLTARHAAAAAALIFGVVFVADWPAAQEGAQGKPRPDAVADAGRGSGPKNVIEGKDEDDRLTGTDAEDWIFGRKGQDIIAGGRGRDVIDAGEGEDTVDGGADNDIIDGGAGNDSLRGGEGNDTIEGNDDDDVIEGGAGVDDADGGDGNDVLRGAAGNDVLAGGDGDDSLAGGADNDRLSGNDGIDSIAGGAGNDIIAGGDGDDTALGEAGDDTIDGGQGDDTLKGGPGNDTLTGSAGGDFVDGGNDQDTLFGGDGRDFVNGGSGADLLLGGAGTDAVNGGDGDDIVVIRAGDVGRGDTEVVDGGPGEDLLTLSGFTPRDLAPGRFMDPLTSGTYLVANVERVQHTHVIPHVGLDPTRLTSFLLVNPSPTEASSGRLLFYGEGGTRVTPRAEALKSGAFSLPPLGAVVIEAFAPEAGIVASAQVFSSLPLGLNVRTSSAALGTFGATESALLDGAIVPINDDATGGSGVLITNSLLRSLVKLTVRSAAGAELECCSATVELAPYAQRTVWVRELFPRLGDFQGALTVEVGSDRPQEGGPLAIVALQRRGTVVTATPAVRITPGAGSGPFVFSSMTAGGDSGSSLILMNPSFTARARGTVAFADQQGRPWPVSLNKQPPAATTPFDLAPLATLVLTTVTGGPVQTGFAHVEAKEGNVGGVMRVITGASVVDTTPATAATAFVAAVVRDRAAGITTELAVTSSGQATTVQVTLHDQTGAAVPGGTAQVRVPGNGQVVRTFDDLFPNVKVQTLHGTVVVASDQQVAVTAIRTDPGARAALPVVPTR